MGISQEECMPSSCRHGYPNGRIWWPSSHEKIYNTCKNLQHVQVQKKKFSLFFMCHMVYKSTTPAKIFKKKGQFVFYVSYGLQIYNTCKNLQHLQVHKKRGRCVFFVSYGLQLQASIAATIVIQTN